MAARPLTRREVETLNHQLLEGMRLPAGNFNRSLTLTDHNFRLIGYAFDMGADAVDGLTSADYEAKLGAAIDKNPDLMLAQIMAAGEDEKKKN